MCEHMVEMHILLMYYGMSYMYVMMSPHTYEASTKCCSIPVLKSHT